ncbi:MAG TPA: hypothetical protein VHE35_11350 [Kofleriaceae bacterium]|nr:hypothetical protein [Kofleriaceae bacterium]
MRGRWLAALIVAAVSVAGCERAGHDAPRVDPSRVSIGKQVTVRTDVIGLDPACQPTTIERGGQLIPYVPPECVGKAPDPARMATFALVHADNGDDHDADVTLGGVLVDADGHEVGRLAPSSLRIPAHGRRTFALVDDEQKARPTATEARIDVRTATRAEQPETVRITDGDVTRIAGQVVASGTVENLTDRTCQAVVIAGFQDASGRPITRPFALYQLGPHARKAAVFTGPPGTATGYIFVGQVEF